MAAQLAQHVRLSFRRVGWTFVDQALSSLTNAALAIVVARSVGAPEFGAFALALIAFSFLVGLARCIIAEPYIIQFAAAEPPEQRRAAAAATGAAMTLGLVAGGVLLGGAFLVHGVEHSALAAVAIWMPGLMLQDTWRHVFFAVRRPHLAALNDAVWALAQASLLGIALIRGSDIGGITSAWGASATIAAVFGVAQARTVPELTATRSWLRQTRKTYTSLGTGYVVNAGAVHSSTWMVGVVSGLPAVAALRSAQVLLGPLNFVFAAFNAYVLPMMSRKVAAGHGLVQAAVRGSGLLGVVSMLWLAVLLLVPDSLGVRVLGQNWAGADLVMLPSGLVLVAGALVLGASNGMMALGRSDLVLRTTLVQAPLFFLSITYAVLWGVSGAAWGFVFAQTIGLLWAWWQFLDVASEVRPPARRATR